MEIMTLFINSKSMLWGNDNMVQFKKENITKRFYDNKGVTEK